jgi:S1-C subfamily serine protease
MNRDKRNNYGLNREVKVAKGILSSDSEIFEDVIQTDTAINPGNSGGPLLNMEGEVIGVNFATIEGASNLSFALPINRVKQRIAELEQYGKFKIPFIGVEYRTKIIYEQNSSYTGAEIIKVFASSPAARAGLKAEDEFVYKLRIYVRKPCLIQRRKQVKSNGKYFG